MENSYSICKKLEGFRKFLESVIFEKQAVLAELYSDELNAMIIRDIKSLKLINEAIELYY